MSHTSIRTLLDFLPEHLAAAVEQLSTTQLDAVEELRLRIGGSLTAVTAQGDYVVPAARERAIESEDLLFTLERATGASLHTALSSLRHGFLPVRGGHRIGVCGTLVAQDGLNAALRDISSLNLRIAHEMTGIAAVVLPALMEQGRLCNTLILSPPGAGKTTLLRDMLRSCSEGEGVPPMRVGVADERGELCAMHEGQPQLSIGRRTDVVCGGKKAEGLMLLLRGMNPEVLAVDEMTAQEDMQAVEQAIGCGVTVLATAHTGSMGDLMRRTSYRQLAEKGLFSRFVLVDVQKGQRQYEIYNERRERLAVAGN